MPLRHRINLPNKQVRKYLTELFILQQGKMIYGIFVYNLIRSRKYCIHYFQSQARRYTIIRKRFFRNFIKISCILIDRCGIKSTGSFKIFILAFWTKGSIDPILPIFGIIAQKYSCSKKDTIILWYEKYEMTTRH